MSWSGTDDSGDSGVATYDVLTVTALDPFRNTATGYNGDVHFTSSDRATMLPDDYIFTAADQGVHTFPGLVLETPGVATIMTSDPGQPSITGQATSTLEFPIPTADSQPVGSEISHCGKAAPWNRDSGAVVS